jgi:ribonuclease P protein component
MLAKSKRINRSAVGSVLKDGRLKGSAHFSIRTSPSETSSASVVVSKKVIPRATGRNLLRRRVYHVLQDIIPQLPQPIKIMVFAKKGVSVLTYKEIEAEIRYIIT